MWTRVQVNGEIVSIQRVCTPAGEQQLKKLIQDHVDLTGSKKGEAILQDWSSSLQKFWQLVPPSGAPLSTSCPCSISLLSQGMQDMYACPSYTNSGQRGVTGAVASWAKHGSLEQNSNTLMCPVVMGRLHAQKQCYWGNADVELVLCRGDDT